MASRKYSFSQLILISQARILKQEYMGNVLESKREPAGKYRFCYFVCLSSAVVVCCLVVWTLFWKIGPVRAQN